jgi:hypothetical protein
MEGLMYFWKTKKLEAELRNGSLSQSDRYKYLMAFMIIVAICTEISLYIPETLSFISLFGSSFVVLITIIGTMFCYKVNRQGDNTDFIGRYICLFLPVTVRLIVFYILIYALYMILGTILLGYAFEKFTDSTNWIDVIFAIGLELIFYWKLSVSIRRVAMSGTDNDL